MTGAESFCLSHLFLDIVSRLAFREAGNGISKNCFFHGIENIFLPQWKSTMVEICVM